MKQFPLLLSFLLIACGNSEPGADHPTRTPVSVRGWIADVDTGAPRDTFRTVETEAARRIAMFQQTSVWVENVAYVSGGVAETGAFMLLDVPPGKVTVAFNAPGAQTAKIVLENVPGNADVFIPGLVLTKDGSSIDDPKAIRIRLPAQIQKARATNLVAMVGGHKVPVVETPLKELMDRRDYPDAPGMGSGVPLATVK